MNVMGRLIAILVKRAHGGRMDPQPVAQLEAGRGIVGNANRGGRRQVTLISQERWNELMAEVGASLGPEARRANFVLAGIDLENTRDRVLVIGRCRLRIGGETRPCEQMEEAAAGLQAAMSERWGGGAFAEVLDGGAVEVGDEVAWE
jgi:MOSC domain-containing protein YiiM